MPGSLLAFLVWSSAALSGDWMGTLDTGSAHLRVILHVRQSTSGALTATMDSPDQGAYGIPVERVALSGHKLTFEAQRVAGRYEGTFDPEKRVIRGLWTQGPGPLPLDFRPYTPPAPNTGSGKRVQPSDIDGDWQGTLQAGAQRLRLLVHIRTVEDGSQAVTLDSLDQGARGIPANSVWREGSKFGFEMRGIGAKYGGVFNDERTKLTGTWTQGESLTLILERVGR